MTGDVYRRDEDGYYWFVARADDMIVSSGYNIAGPEVEAALALHPDVEECAVIGWPDPERGQIVKAVVVPKPGAVASPELAKALQEHIKQTLGALQISPRGGISHRPAENGDGKIAAQRAARKID